MMRRTIPPILATAAALLAAAPAGAQLAITTDLVNEREVTAGQTYRGTIRIVNHGAAAQDAKVYATDYQFAADGSSRYDEPGTTARSNARWVRFHPSYLMVPAGGAVEVAYEVTVPADGSLAGSFWSLLMVEAVAPPAQQVTARPVSTGRPAVGLQPVVRYAVQIATHVTGEALRRVDLAGPSLTATAAGAELAFDVINAGERAVRPEIRLELFDAQGRPAGTFVQARGLVYPGSSFRQRFEIAALPRGEYTALVLADAGQDAVSGARFRLTF